MIEHAETKQTAVSKYNRLFCSLHDLEYSMVHQKNDQTQTFACSQSHVCMDIINGTTILSFSPSRGINRLCSQAY